jgi:hypothetical protein
MRLRTFKSYLTFFDEKAIRIALIHHSYRELIVGG